MASAPAQTRLRVGPPDGARLKFGVRSRRTNSFDARPDTGVSGLWLSNVALRPPKGTLKILPTKNVDDLHFRCRGDI
jgi:hypothetical protein